MNKNIFGFLFIYVFLIYIVGYLLYTYAPFTRFITYIANIDLMANVLATNFPDYFKLSYNIEPESIIGYISFNIITLISLSGIFLYGLQLTLIGHSNIVSFRSMILVSIITFTLPTMLIPYITKHVKSFVHHIALNYIEGEHLEKSEETKEIKLTDEVINKIAIFISIGVAVGFIFLEGYVIENHVHKHNFSAKGRRIFGKKHDNPLENLFK